MIEFEMHPALLKGQGWLSILNSPLGVLFPISVITTALLIRGVYNIYFHPLRLYAGPKLWASTQVVWVYYRLTGQLPWKSLELHRKYGPVVRVAPDHLSYTTETAWKTIYGLRKVEMEKNTQAGFSRPAIKDAHSILSADKANHSLLRRILAPALSEKAIKGHDDTIVKYVDLLVEKLGARCDPVDLNKYFEWATMDLITDLICGQPQGALDQENGVRWGEYLIPKARLTAAYENSKIIAAKIEKRLSIKTDRLDIMSYMVREKDGMSEVEMRLNSAIVIGAGTGTTATWLSTNFHSLTTHPDAYKKLTTEIRGSFSSAKDITSESTIALPYLSAVMQESLRIRPPSPSSTGRFVPVGGKTIDGQFVPEGTTVGVHQHSAYHAKWNFHRPDDFCPERWLPESRENKSPFSSDNLGVLNPFSYGPRTCLGVKLTTAETRLILAKVL
ncbi:hypothetical protein N7488_010734 [Penicillium malachiteum]|nr:hypothetical protein N7488_010734 [Penicillium malachiteum]